MSVHEITRTSLLQTSKNTVHRRIIESGYMIYAKIARRLPLSNLHISKRLQCVRNHMLYGDKWMAVLFSDEKKNGTSMDLKGIENIGMIYEKIPEVFSVGKVVDLWWGGRLSVSTVKWVWPF
ncbi:hypothetical protein AVEN_140878-1 [Araneus ventricosus]|uniref:Transposase Tc1-like domain-containing protein n=1 Tax=Araneus ventricosus TaxID=182803 RepID=A0A4Y2VLX1_ARAVE|nr:hypothetical protein AVEN_140878-1 [Araneus ventricosus]